MAKENIKVKKSHRLHAKIYMTQNAAIVGSANAPSAGLDANPPSDKEAALLTNDVKTLRRISFWFEKQWKLADDIAASDLAQAEKRLQNSSRLKLRCRRQKRAEFLEKLDLNAFERVMRYAALKNANGVRLGMTGERHSEPNFVLVYPDGSQESFNFPSEAGVAKPSSKA